jgi:hypothetical protein
MSTYSLREEILGRQYRLLTEVSSSEDFVRPESRRSQFYAEQCSLLAFSMEYTQRRDRILACILRPRPRPIVSCVTKSFVASLQD